MKTKKEIIKDINQYLELNNINFKYLDPAFKKTIIFYNKSDVMKVLSYLYKNHRKFYFSLDSLYIAGKKQNNFKSKIFIEYDGYLFNCINNIKFYYISFVY